MRFQAVLLFFVLAANGLASVPVTAQEDPNAQQIVLVSGALAGEPRELEVPVESTVLRLFFTVQAGSEIKWEIISPLGKPLALQQSNITVTEAGERRTVALWDPRAGRWRVRLTGVGAYRVAASVQSELYACCLQLPGRQMAPPLERIPLAQGARQQATVYVTGNGLETVNFQMVNEQGETLAPVKFRQSDYSNPYNFTLFIEPPAQPFRVMVRGREANGQVFQRTYPQLFAPQPAALTGAPGEAPPPAAAAPNGPEWQDAVTGDYRIVRAQVVSYSDELLLSDSGNPIGIRFKYALKFPADGSYTPLPSLYPERISSTYTGALSLRLLKSVVEPRPEGAPLSNQILYTGRVNYQRDTIYHFTVDLAPNYAIYNEQTKTFCLQIKAFSPQGLRERFDREVQSASSMRFRFAINGTDYDGRQPLLTEKAYVPLQWYNGLLKEGARECP